MFARFSINADVPASMLRITMSGFFELPDIKRFVSMLRIEHTKLRCRKNQHVTLVDIRDMKIQPQGSVEGFQNVLNDPALVSRRIAFIVEPGLARAQIQRAAAGRPAMYFSTLAAAEAWLMSDAIPIADVTCLPPLIAAMRVLPA